MEAHVPVGRHPAEVQLRSSDVFYCWWCLGAQTIVLTTCIAPLAMSGSLRPEKEIAHPLRAEYVG